MVILATLPNHSLFSSLPTTSTRHPSGNSSTTRHPSPGPPIPIPKYPPKPKPKPKPKPHNLTKFHKPIPPSGEKIPAADDRAVVIGENGVSYLLPDAPFEFQFSYSETPKAKPVAIRQPVFLPFAPPSMGRPWTGKAPLKKKKEKKKIPVFDSFNPPPPGKKGMKVVEMPGPYKMGQFPKEGKSREEILGEPLSKAEIKMLIQPLLSDNRQINLGRDGLTHNMLELIHTHWKRRRVCKVKCKGVPTVDMNNVCKHLEEKTGGKIIHRAGGVVYLFRGRNYNYRTRPQYPLMLWKPAAPVYPKLIQDAPEGLTKEEADELRKKGKSLSPICKLAKNGVYDTLVRDVRYAFEASPLVKVDCRGLDPSDYKKIGAKLMELVPCVLLSFDDQQILMWRGRDWKSMYPDPPPNTTHSGNSDANVSYPDSSDCNPREHGIATVRSSPRMMSLWKHAIELHKALLLDKTTGLSPDALLQKVEEFEAMTQENEHSDPALLISGKESEVRYENSSEDDTIGGEEEEDYDDDYDEYTDSDPFDDADLPVSLGSLPVDHLAKRLQDDRYFR